jgi:type IV pilus assembly protein PilO
MADLSKLRTRFKVMAGILAAVALLAAFYLLAPVGQSNAELYKELDQTRNDFKSKEAQVKPLRGLPQKLVATHEQIGKFYVDRLPAKQSVVSEEIGKLAIKSGVTLSDVRYENLETDIPELRAVIVDAQLSGEYAKVARFINAVERNKTFFLVDGLTLDEQKSGNVRLKLNLETFLRPATPGASSERPSSSAGAAKTGD